MKKICLLILIFVFAFLPLSFILSGCSQSQAVIISIEKAETIGLQDRYKIVYSDGTENYFTITNGKQGDAGHSPIVTIGTNGNWFIDGIDSNFRAQVISIKSINKTSSNGNVDTYTITLTDDSTTYFTITNGINGIQGIQGLKGDDGHTPIITIGSNGNWFIDNVDTNIKAEGINGLSAYELYIKNNPNYTKSEQEWLNDLACGHLGQVKITFDSNGGSQVDNQTISFGTYANNVEIPTKDGYIFKCWSLNGSEIDINTFTFFTDSTVIAVYTPKNFDIMLNADGGNLENNSVYIVYGETYSLPTPTLEYKSFANWYLGDIKIPNNGVWTYSKIAVQLKAVYNSTKIYANLSVDENYGTIDTKKITLTVGENYVLPIPTPTQNEMSFQGWFNGGVKYTDKNGNSLQILLDTATINLTANYYTEINNVYQILAMGSAESTTGNYVITKDLDFAGLEMTPIENFSGIFDGGGHTLSNITINKGIGNYGGFFGQLCDYKDTTIRNIVFDNLNQIGGWSAAGGIVGYRVKNKGKFIIDNIEIYNSFNQSENIQGGFGMIGGKVERISSSIGYVSNIKIVNSGLSLKAGSSFGFCTAKYLNISNVVLESSFNYNVDLCGLFASTGEYVSINKFINRINGLTASITKRGGTEINVSNSCNYANSVVAWGGVTKLSNCISTGFYQSWGAGNSINCIDVNNEYGTYVYNTISNSIILYQNADGSYYYFTSGGKLGTISDITLITKDLFISLLSFDENIWDLDNIDLSNNIYPTLRGV